MTSLLTEWDPSEFDPEIFTISPEDAALPEVDVSQLPVRNPAEDQEEQDDLDDSDLEGLGAGEQIWERAVPRARQKVRTNATNVVGYCLKEIRTINETQALAFDADESLSMCDSVIRLDNGNWEKAPRGFLFYFTGGEGNTHGHIGEIFGNAYGASTDYPTGHWGRVSLRHLFERWGYMRAYAANQVNGNTVRTLNTPKPPPPPKYPGISEEIIDLARLRKLHRSHDHPAVAAHLTRAIQELRTIPGM